MCATDDRYTKHQKPLTKRTVSYPGYCNGWIMRSCGRSNRTTQLLLKLRSINLHLKPIVQVKLCVFLLLLFQRIYELRGTSQASSPKLQSHCCPCITRAAAKGSLRERPHLVVEPWYFVTGHCLTEEYCMVTRTYQNHGEMIAPKLSNYKTMAITMAFQGVAPRIIPVSSRAPRGFRCQWRL